MAVERYIETIQALGAGTAPVERGTGNFLLVLSSTANVTVSLVGGGMTEKYANISGGLYIRRMKPWNNLRIDGALGTQVAMFYGHEPTNRDETDVRLQIATLSGIVSVADTPAGALADTPAIATAAGQHQLFVQNLGRRRMTVFADSANTTTVYGRKAGGANNIAAFPPGSATEIKGTYAMDYDDASAGGQKLYLFEES